MNRVNLFISSGEMHEESAPDGEFVYYEDAQAAIQAAVLAEREACADLIEAKGLALIPYGYRNTQFDIHIADVLDRAADDIRARSKS